MTRVLVPLAFLSLLATGAIFGFFYAWVCSTMWGLDTADPRVAIAAMQAMNASVRNGVFALGFFGTPVLLGGTACLAFFAGRRLGALSFALAALIYLAGGLILTTTFNVALNVELAQAAVPETLEQARAIWQPYSDDWQYFNILRTVAAGVSLILVGSGIILIPAHPAEGA